MKFIVEFVVVGIWILGFVVALAGIIIACSRGGEAAAPRDASGRLPLPRKLMLAGAALGALGGLLMFVPGFIPWWEHDWWHGAIFGYLLCFVIQQISKVRCGLANTRNQVPRV